MKKKSIICILSALMISSIISFKQTNVSASEITNNSNDNVYLQEQIPTKYQPDSPDEKKAAEDKLRLAEEYCKTKASKNTSNSNVLKNIKLAASGHEYNSIPVSCYREEKGYYCGPASAYSAIVAKKSLSTLYNLNNNVPFTQTTLALHLGTTTGGTVWGSRWISTMNAFLPENNYEKLDAQNYSSNWLSKLKSSVEYTVDKGYAVIIDTKQDVGGIKIWPTYSYIDERGPGGRSTYHYLVINGYDHYKGEYDLMSIIDSNSNTSIPGNYWANSSNVAAVSKLYGIIY